MKRLFQLLGVFLIGVGGFALVVAAVLVMNRPHQEPEANSPATTIDFTVPVRPPDPPPEPPEREERRTASTDRAPVVPAPNLSGSLSGIAVRVPDFEVQGVDSVAESLLGDLDNVALTEDAVDTKPIPQTRPLTYPERARQRKIEGRVVVSVLIDAQGNVQNVKILEAEPPNVFNEAVLNAVPNWTFEPAKYQGRPVQTWARIPIPFRLN